MSADETFELAVQVAPEGAEETQAVLEDTSEAFEETAETAGQESGTLERFSRRWQGAMNVITAGLALAAAGLATQIPIVADLMDGFGAILEAVALQIDRVLRPRLQGLNDALFETAESIGMAEGPMGNLIGVVGSLGLALGGLAGALRVVDFLTFGRSTSFLASALARVVPLAKGLVGTLAGLPGATAAAAAGLGALIGLFAVYILEVTGVNDAVERLGATLAESLPGWARDGLLALVGIFGGIFAILGGFITGFVDGFIEGGLVEGIDQGVARARQIFDIFAGAIGRLLDGIVDFVTDWGGALASAFRQAAERAANRFLAPIRAALRTARRIARRIAGLRGGRGGGRRNVGEFQTGGRIVQGGLAEVHAGEEIVPAAQAERTPNPTNRFAEREEMVVRFEPAQFEQFVSAQLEDGPANTGRSSGPQG